MRALCAGARRSRILCPGLPSRPGALSPSRPGRAPGLCPWSRGRHRPGLGWAPGGARRGLGGTGAPRQLRGSPGPELAIAIAVPELSLNAS